MTTRSKYKKSEESRQQVLDAAIATIARKGFSQTSVQDVADTAKMSKGAVHYHFDSKDDLIQHVLTQCCEALSSRVRTAWESPGTPMERIRRAVEEMWATRKEAGVEIRVISELIAQGVHDEKLRKPLAQMFRSNREEILDACVNGLVAMGLRPKVPPAIIPRLLLGAIDGLALHAVFDPPPPEEEAEMIKAIEVVAFGLFEL